MSFPQIALNRINCAEVTLRTLTRTIVYRQARWFRDLSRCFVLRTLPNLGRPQTNRDGGAGYSPLIGGADGTHVRLQERLSGTAHLVGTGNALRRKNGATGGYRSLSGIKGRERKARENAIGGRQVPISHQGDKIGARRADGLYPAQIQDKKRYTMLTNDCPTALCPARTAASP